MTFSIDFLNKNEKLSCAFPIDFQLGVVNEYDIVFKSKNA